jgi:hypothetical protein
LFRNADLSPEQQYALTKARTIISFIVSVGYMSSPPSIVWLQIQPSAWRYLNYNARAFLVATVLIVAFTFSALTNFQAFDPASESYGHGNNQTGKQAKSILHPDLKTIPRVPQVQLIGNGPTPAHEGLPPVQLKHPSHTSFHKTHATAPNTTRFYRWHIDAALYALSPPKVTTLYGIRVPQGSRQTCLYDDGTGDELPVPLGTTAFVSGRTMFDILPRDLQSVAVRAKVRYAPHPYVWMASAHAMSTGLGIESENLELAFDQLPDWTEENVKTYPVVRSPHAGSLESN